MATKPTPTTKVGPLAAGDLQISAMTGHGKSAAAAIVLAEARHRPHRLLQPVTHPVHGFRIIHDLKGTDMTIKRLSRPFLITLLAAAVLSMASACPANTTAACAAVTVVSQDTPPEPITDGSYRDGAEEAPPEPIEDGSYRDGAGHKHGQKDRDNNERVKDRTKSRC
ncbi:hypothetical protein [Streptosporangium sp. NPDC051022]|uniref:hypothetical protein n=1 Tax=Streptosporangium sp. NPDC051022 TaxID=3155752 RepID=UPI0034255C10